MTSDNHINVFNWIHNTQLSPKGGNHNETRHRLRLPISERYPVNCIDFGVKYE